MPKLNPSSLYLTPEEFDQLQELAVFCEYFQQRGAGARLKAPNISALARALANLPKEQWSELKELLQGVANGKS